ncbi:hypothetical protein Tco_1361745 [Tanacetum coccineum]
MVMWGGRYAHVDRRSLPYRGSQKPNDVMPSSVDTSYLLIYVDDIVLTASSTALLQKMIFSLHMEFDMTDLGALNYFLGIWTPISDPTLYRSLVGGLLYLTFTRLDLSYVLYASLGSSLVAYSDADWAGCPATHKSTSGYCVFLGNNLLSRSSKRQPTISRSSVEVERISKKRTKNGSQMNDKTRHKSDEVIKSSVENLVLIPSESEGIPDNVCDVPLYIDYVDASPPDAEIVSLEVVEIVIPEVGDIDTDILLTIKDDILREKLYTFDNSLPESETFCLDLEEISSGSPTTRSDYSLSDYEAFCDNLIEEKSSGSTATHADFSQYVSFIFDLSINPFPPTDRSDFYHEEFADELAHIISPSEYDHFCFKIEPELGNLTMDVVEDIFPTREPRVHVPLF